MKTIKFAVFAFAGSFALLTNSVQASTATPIALSFTTYAQVASTNSAGVITYSTTTTTWNNATILAKVSTTLGISIPAGARLAVSTADDSVNGVTVGDVVVINSAGHTILDLSNRSNDEFGEANGITTSTGFVLIDFGVTPLVAVTKSAKLSYTTQFTGTGEIHAEFELFGTETVLEGAVKHEGIIFGDTSDDFFDINLAVTGSATTPGQVFSSFTSDRRSLATANIAGTGAGEYEHFDVNGEILQPTDSTLTSSFSGAVNPISFFTYFHTSEDED